MDLTHSFQCQYLHVRASMVKNLPANSGDAGSIPGSRGSPGEGNDHPLQYSCLENPVDRGAWWATVHGVAKELDMTSVQFSSVAQSCPSLWDSMDCSPPSFPVHGILQAGILEWVAFSFSRGSFQPRDRTQVSHIADRFFTN